MYRIREFAAMAGVTVRTLHHYDRIGLLKPRRTHTRYRVYGDIDLVRLQQILVLKFLGLSLGEIAGALKSDAQLDELLKDRRFGVHWKRARLAIELDLLDELDAGRGGQRNWPDLAAFVQELGGKGDLEAPRQQRRLQRARRRIAERRVAWNATLHDYELNRDIRDAIARGDTPDSPAGQALVARWCDAIERFVGGDEEIRTALQLVMNDRVNSPSAPAAREFQQYFDRALKQAS